MCLWEKKNKPKVLQNHTLKIGTRHSNLCSFDIQCILKLSKLFHRHYLLQGSQGSKEVNRTDVLHDVSEKSAGSQKGPVAFPGKHSNT